MFFSCILEGNTSFLRSFIDYDLKDKSYREVKKERSASFTFELDILDNLDNPDVIDELLDLRIKEENSYLYLLDNLYIDKKDIPFSKEDYFISINKNFLNKKNNNLKEGLEISPNKNLLSFSSKMSFTVLKAASITPPVTPKITPAPVYFASGDVGVYSSKFLKSISFFFIQRASSLVVSTTSTSLKPSDSISGLLASNFLAIQGIIEITRILSLSTPIFSA